MEQQVIDRKASGLFTHPNRIDLPPGALVKADNAVILRDGIVSKRRGFNYYGTPFTSMPSEIFEYLERLIVYEALTLQYDSNGTGTFLDWTGSFSPPTGERMTALEVDKLFLFTTSLGVFANDELTGTPVRSGIPAGLDLQIALTGTGGGWFTPGTQVGYRVLFGRTNANEQLLLGDPSWRETLLSPLTAVDLAEAGGTVTVTHTLHGYTTGDIVEISDASDADYENGPHTITVVDPNTYTYTVSGSPASPGTANAGKKFNVSFTATIPSDIAAGDFYEVYRTVMSAGANIDPGMRHFKVVRTEIASGDITNGFVTFTDTFDEALLGEDLYTNDTVETEGQSNDRPPYAKFMAYYEGHVFYANILDEQEVQIQLNAVAGLTDNSSAITFSDDIVGGSYIFDTAENIATRHFKRFTGEPTTAQNIEKTMKSFCKVMNRDSTVHYAFYVSGIDDAPGKVVIRHRALSGDSFAITADLLTTGQKFQPVIPISGTAVHSVNNARANIIRNAKFQRPQAVPKANERRAGPEGKEVLGMVTVPQALLIFTEDGLYVLSGTTDSSGGFTFTLERKDPAVILMTPYALVGLDNNAHGYTTQGIMRCNQAGSSVVSRAIEQDLQRVALIDNFRSLASAAAYESDREYLFMVPDSSIDTHNTQIMVYNYFTNAWTRWGLRCVAGRVLSSNDKLYLIPVDPADSGGTIWKLLQERKSYGFSKEDYQDQLIDMSGLITAIGTTENDDGDTVVTMDIEWTRPESLVGGLLNRSLSSITAKIISAELQSGNTYYCILDRNFTPPALTAWTLAIGIHLEIERIEDAGSAGTLKQWCFVQFYPEENWGLNNQVGFWADHQRNREFVTVRRTGRLGWGSNPWGSTPWGDREVAQASALRVPVPRNHARSRVLRTLLRNRFAKETIDLLQTSFDVRVVGARTERGPQ